MDRSALKQATPLASYFSFSLSAPADLLLTAISSAKRRSHYACLDHDVIHVVCPSATHISSENDYIQD